MSAITASSISSRPAARGRWVPALLFVASALFVVWKLTQVAALVDVAYILDTASRIAQGDVPYAGFRLAHPPLTFVVQAVLIRVFGPHYVVPMAYAAVASGIATVLAYRIAARILGDVFDDAKAIALLLAVPLVTLGIYAIFPHAHYDPDAGLAELVALTVVIAARDRPTRLRWLAAGALLVVPLFIKQNIGVAFVPSALAVVALDAAQRRRVRAELVPCLAGLLAALAGALVVIQLVAGVDNYVRWTLTYAIGERGVLVDRIALLWDPRLVTVGILMLVGTFIATRLDGVPRLIIFATLACLPLALVAGSHVVFLWPSFLVAALVLCVRRAAVGDLDLFTQLPVVALGTLVGTAMSLGVGSSSFGTFPLLVITIASFVRSLRLWQPALGEGAPRLLLIVAALALLVSGTAYSVRMDRIAFIDLAPDMPIVRSSYPSLAGLSARGPYVDELDELLRWIDANVGPGEPATFLPGEDPVYYALGLHPGLPVVQLIDGSNPYSASELAAIADASGLRWVFVERRFQLLSSPPDPTHPVIVAALTKNAEKVATVGRYDVYRRP